MKQTTICFLMKEGRVLLGMKKRGFGAGKWNGFGGKVDEGEEVTHAMVRELKEEIGVDVAAEDLRDAGTLTFTFKDNGEWDQLCHVFTLERWVGEPSESEEMRPSWYPLSSLPFDAMWVDDPHWVPFVLSGKKVNGKFLFDDKGGELLNFAVSTK
jgi:8-oxo-dGTP pyrophosphatase MutT (NUDIX family)